MKPGLVLVTERNASLKHGTEFCDDPRQTARFLDVRVTVAGGWRNMTVWAVYNNVSVWIAMRSSSQFVGFFGLKLLETLNRQTGLTQMFHDFFRQDFSVGFGR